MEIHGEITFLGGTDEKVVKVVGGIAVCSSRILNKVSNKNHMNLD